MGKFANPVVKLGDKEVELRLDGNALSRLEDAYDLPFSEALGKLVTQLNSEETRTGRFRISFIADLVVWFAKDRYTREQVTAMMENPIKDMGAIAQGVGKLLSAHLPATEEGTGNAGDDADPKSADKA